MHRTSVSARVCAHAGSMCVCVRVRARRVELLGVAADGDLSRRLLVQHDAERRLRRVEPFDVVMQYVDLPHVCDTHTRARARRRRARMLSVER
jgi:hypothetical protein